MWKKATIPVSAGVFVLGLVMIIVSVVNGGSGGDSSPDSSSVGGVTVADEDVDTTEVLDFSGFVTSTAVAQVSSGQSSTSGGQSNAGSSGMPPVSPTTIAPPSGTPTTFAFSGIPAPSNPGLPGLGLPSRDSYAPPTTPAAGGGFIVVVSSCSSFQECAQKLYEQWINGEHCFFDDLDSAFATQAVYDTMRAYCGNTSGQWNPLTQGAGRYQLAGVSNRTSSPKVIVFNMVPGQTDPIVRSVQIQ